MKSHQINFFMTPEDAVELQQYINLQGLVVVATSNTVCEPKIIETFTNIKDLKIYFTLPKFLKDIKMNYFENRDEYVVIDYSSTLIEYIASRYDKESNEMNKGRLYYKTVLYNETDEEKQNDEDFLIVAKNLFNWFKKHFKDTKINSRHTTKRTMLWAKQNNVKLAIN